MKSNYLIFSLFIILLSTSCNKEDNGIIAPPASNEFEDIPLDANTVTDNFEIFDAIKVQGTIPAPSGNLVVPFSTDEQTAFLKTGFNVEFESNTEVVGAYLQLVNDDGSKADTYFDISAYSFQVGLTEDEEKGKLLESKNGPGNTVVNVDFGSGMTPGTFCYVLCFYDANGNISEPMAVCVEVESWGGFDQISGDWNMVRYTTDGEETNAGETYCRELFEYPCDGESSYMAANFLGCEMEEMRFIMDVDGEFQYWYEEEKTYLDYTASDLACEAIYKESYVVKSYYEGKWAYDEEEQTLTMILFNGATGGIDHDFGNGQLGYSGVTTISPIEMIINHTYTDWISEEEIEEVYFFSK